jgi:cytochrome P450
LCPDSDSSPWFPRWKWGYAVSVSLSIPRFVDLSALRANPLSFLQAAQSSCEGLVVISEDGPIFSRARNCSAAVAVFGPRGIQQVLTDADLFGTVVSVGELFSLPSTLLRLNAGLFSMQGEQHRSHQQMLRSMIGAAGIAVLGDAIDGTWQGFTAELSAAQDVALLSAMRRLVLRVSQQIVFGRAEIALGELIRSYFEIRRSLSGSQSPPGLAARRELIHTGYRLDRLLRQSLASLREENAASAAGSRCLLGRLAKLAADGDARLSDDQLIAHANMLVMSSSEPVAVALTWILVLLSQQPSLRLAIQHELANPAKEVVRLPLERLVEMHISGLEVQSDTAWDDHAGLADDLTFELMEIVLARARPSAVTFEYNWAPDLIDDIVVDQVGRVRAMFADA